MTYGEGNDYAGAIGPLKQAILGRMAATAHARGVQPAAALPAHAAIAARHNPAVYPMPGLGDLSASDLIEIARGDASIFGLDSGDVGIAAGATVTISTSPQRDCVPVRLIVDDALASVFAISQIQVGVDPVMITPGTNCSLAAFTAGSFAPDFRAARLRAPISFSVTVTNLSGGPARFLASVFAIYFPSSP